ncbi:MAG TPA: tripartite tricarboxylate transporter substrate binding protein [Xanthobacteraceae bacterium]
MPFPRRRFLRLAAGAAALPALGRRARAQSYPARPVRIVVGYPAGGSTDLVARIIGARLSERLGQSFVIENKPGAGTNLAAQAVVAAAPDGYTLLFVATTNAINASFHKTLPFDFLRDIAPVAGLVDLPFVMEVGASVPVKTVAELVALAKAEPGKVNTASFGTGTISHLAWELFKSMTGVEVVHVPYPGGAPMVTDMIAGRVQAGIDALPNSLPHIQSGALRALAVTGPARTDKLPDVPTVGETVKGYEVSGWTGIGVPAGTPKEIVATLNREINAALSDPGIAARLADVGGRPIILTPDAFGKVWLRDTDKWAKVLQASAAKPQ